MNRKSESVLEILVEIDPAGCAALDSEIGSVCMIPFKGTASGPIFTGVVEPCGVDTQVLDQSGVRHMSARYMLTGRDRTGRDCRIYVENNGWLTNGGGPGPFSTVPTFMTDSRELAPFLHRSCFVGEGRMEESGLWIRFYELEEQAGPSAPTGP